MRKYALFILLGVAFAVLLLPFFLGTTAAHPATDDFTFATYTHPTYLKTGSLLHVLKDAASYTLRTWRDWQGTMTGVLIMALNPAVFSLKMYGMHAVVLLLLHLAAWAVFLHHFLAVRLGLPGRMWILFYFVLSAISLIFLPDIVEGIYWFNGAWFYTGAQAAALLTLTLCDGAASGNAHDPWYLKRLLGWVLLFLLGMDNYITAMMCFMGTLMIAAIQWYTADGPDKRARVRTAIGFVFPIATGLLISVIAPGNKVRMAVDGAHESGFGWLAGAVVQTLWAGLFYTGRFLVKTPLLAFLLAVIPSLLSVRAGRNLSVRRLPPAAVIAGYFLVLWGMLFPHIYSSGYAGSGRVINMYHDYVVIALPIVLILCLPDTAGRIQRPVWYLVSAAALCFCLWLGQQHNYVKLVSDQLDGTQAAYTAQFQKEYAILEAAGPDSDVILPAWKVQTVTGKPTAYADPAVWTNESMASYFNVHSVRVMDEHDNMEAATGE
ncbi:MAG: hypothetical protein IJ242_11340 [Clostridia bacterium]|nr:hypothetical protein [Clostridia bacterium]